MKPLEILAVIMGLLWLGLAICMVLGVPEVINRFAPIQRYIVAGLAFLMILHNIYRIVRMRQMRTSK